VEHFGWTFAPGDKVIDSQIHTYEANTLKRSRYNLPKWREHVTGDTMVAATDKVGVG
jgi:hypothetical protein